MSNLRGRSQSIIFLALLAAACLLLCGLASAAPSITLSKKTGPPTSRILVSGRGFAPHVGVDIYFDTKDEAVATANSAGSFFQIAIPASASALPGDHWVSAVGRSGQNHAQARFDVHANWRQFHRLNMQRRNPFENVLNVHNVGKLRLKWIYATGDQVWSSPAVANGVVYVGSYNGNVYALNASTGAKLWTYATADPVVSSPAVANGVVYVGSWDNNVYALNASTGAKLWGYATGDRVYASPAVANGVVYVGSSDRNLYALNASTGALLWSYATGIEYSGPAVANGVVYVGSDYPDNNVYALNASTGGLVWSYAAGCCGVETSPTVANGVVYFGSTEDGNVYALNASTGEMRWKYAAGYDGESSHAVANGVVYFGSLDKNVYALNASTGALLWSYPTGTYVHSSPAVANGVVYVGSADNNVYALNAKTGAKLWSYLTDGYVESSPAVANGVMYVGSVGVDPLHGSVYAFGLPDSDQLKRGTVPQRPDPKTLRPDFSLKPSKPAANTVRP